MRRFIVGMHLLLLFAGAPAIAFAASGCEEESKWVETDGLQHFMILAGRTDVFYDRSGPAFVMLVKAAAQEAQIGALGIYAGDEKQPVFGAVPASTYEEFLRGPRKTTDVVLRLAITGPQYERALEVLQSWDRRVRERALLYPEIALDNILLVKQATEEINRCVKTLPSYDLDWGLQDDISENNLASRVPYEYFKRLDATRDVPDADMPAALWSSADVSQTGKIAKE